MSTPDSSPPSGTRDFLPGEVARRRQVFATIRRVFEDHGFAPLDTPAFERLDVLLGKYGEEGDKLIFKILRRGEHERTGEADLALRYDLTVPLARVMAQYSDQLGEPFKRYHIAPVWRADRPGRGRYREFAQCDVDVVGSASTVADAEVVMVVAAALHALGLDGLDIQVNSRRVLAGLIETYGIPPELEGSTLVALDKLDKIGPGGVVEELRDRGVPGEAVDRLSGDLAGETLDGRVREVLGESEQGRAGLAEVDRILQLAGPRVVGGKVRFAPLLARGLAYYTGPIFEVVAPDLEASIASGGRYDDLIGTFTNRDIPATGGSIGVERVLLLLESGEEAATPADVLVTVFDEEAAVGAVELAARLRQAGLAVDLFPDTGRLGRQLRYADRRGVRFATIRGPDEVEAGTVTVRDLATGEQQQIPEGEVAGRLRDLLGAGPAG